MQTWPIKVVETNEGLLLIDAETVQEAIDIAKNDHSRGHCPMFNNLTTFTYDKDAE